MRPAQIPTPSEADGAEVDSLLDGEPLTLDALTTGVSVFQRRKGHRFSSDDTVTAWVALQVCPKPANVLDLGCGLGSVLLHIGWSVPRCRLTGIEAQAVSFALLRRNIAHNGFASRVLAIHGDLRDPDHVTQLGRRFDLITGTPPYFPCDTATGALDEQRAYARIEYRGGVEAYMAAAARLLADDGWFVMCGDADASGRVAVSADQLGLAVLRHVVVLPRAARPPLFSVWAMRRGPATMPLVEQRLTLRDEAGERTDDAKMLRAFSGFSEGATAQTEVSGMNVAAVAVVQWDEQFS